MKRFLLVTFDFVRQDEPSISLAAGSLLAKLTADSRYGQDFTLDHLSFNLYLFSRLDVSSILQAIMTKCDIQRLSAIAIGCYMWVDDLVAPLLYELRRNGYSGRIVLGGHQITDRPTLAAEYPLADVFVIGYAEEALLSAFMEPIIRARVISRDPDFEHMPSPLVTGVIQVERKQGRVRMETKRGCFRSCRYCAHRDLHTGRMFFRPLDQVNAELVLFHDRQVGKINVVDPLFNYGDTYMAVLRQCLSLGIRSQIALQVCFECIRGSEGSEFLDLCSSLNVLLEFGLQTIVPAEMQFIGRQNDLEHTKRVMRLLDQRRIPYEISLIYGLPAQTLQSFVQSVSWVRRYGSCVIKSFPLRLYKGTELYRDRAQWQLVDTAEGTFHIPCVTTSDSFTRDEWECMCVLAKSARRKSQHDADRARVNSPDLREMI